MVERGAEEDFLSSLGDGRAPLWDLVSLPMDSSRRVACPFHDDPNPSCSIYADHFHCHGCGVHGSRLDWLTEVEGLTHDEAIGVLQDWDGSPALPSDELAAAAKLDFALSLWDAAVPLAGTIGERYLAATRGIDVGRLPPAIGDALRFHPRCPFGSGARHPCLIGLMCDPSTGVPTGIHRIGLIEAGGTVAKIGPMALGRMGIVKLWPLNGAGGQLVVGEGIETVLAAATRLSHRGGPLTPAWSAISAGGLAHLPAIGAIGRLVLLIDNDLNGEGQRAAAACRETWSGCVQEIVPLMPKQPGWDFNDVILGGRS
jgi:hypothetical protein